MKPDELLSAIGELDQHRGSIRALIAAIHSFGPELRSVLEPLVLGAAELQFAAFNRLVQKGMTREEALRVLISMQGELKQSIQQAGQRAAQKQYSAL